MELTILVSLLVVYTAFSVWYFMRNNQVCNFRQDVNNMSYWYSCRKNTTDGWELFYEKLPSYNKMFWSFKPLKIDSYFDEDTIAKLLS